MTQELNLDQFPISKIFVPDNIREPGWEKGLDKLIESIKKNGQLQPVLVFLYQDDKTGPNGELAELVFGHRRVEAFKKMGRTNIKVILTSSKASARDRFIMKLAENDDREGLSPIEAAKFYREAIDTHKFTAKELADRVGKTDGHISQRLALLKLPDPIRTAVEKGIITPTHAREIGRVTDEKTQLKLLKKAESMPITDFKEEVKKLDPDKKKNTNRGRKEKPKADKEKPASTKSRKEIIAALADVDKKLEAAKQSGAKSEINNLLGMQRFGMWVVGFKNAKSLW